MKKKIRNLAQSFCHAVTELTANKANDLFLRTYQKLSNVVVYFTLSLYFLAFYSDLNKKNEKIGNQDAQ